MSSFKLLPVRTSLVAALVAIVATSAIAHSPSAGTSSVVTGRLKAATRTFLATGTARVVSDITGKESTYTVSAVITASSLADARAQAKEALSASAAVYGTVVSVYVRDVW